MEFVTASIAAVGATILSNPLEVVKTRFQLQGELRSKGEHVVHYRNFFHAFYVIARNDGLLGLQKGLVPTLWNQFLNNGIRLGAYQVCEERGLHLDPEGNKSVWRTAGIASLVGGLTAFTASPFNLIKIQLQSQAKAEIAVGHQHDIKGTADALRTIYGKYGVRGLFRGVTGSLPRRCIGSATQLTSYSFLKDILANNEYFPIEKGYLNFLIASTIGGVIVTIVKNPLDVISTRLYNQGVDSKGRGLLYSGYLDCVLKIHKTERLRGFYKGFIPMLIRQGPHNVFILVFWDLLKNLSKQLED